MSDRTIMFPLPKSAPENLERRLNAKVVGESLLYEYFIQHFDPVRDGLSTDEMMDIVAGFSDETLWRILDYRVPYLQKLRNRDLLDKGDFSPDEEKELDDFVDLHGRFVLVRSQALLTLKQRGYDIDRFLEEQFL